MPRKRQCACCGKPVHSEAYATIFMWVREAERHHICHRCVWHIGGFLTGQDEHAWEREAAAEEQER